jgi:hypothetical protein
MNDNNRQHLIQFLQVVSLMLGIAVAVKTLARD